MAEELKVYAVAVDVTSSLGMNLDEHWDSIANGESGIARYEAENNEPYWGG